MIIGHDTTSTFYLYMAGETGEDWAGLARYRNLPNSLETFETSVALGPGLAVIVDTGVWGDRAERPNEGEVCSRSRLADLDRGDSAYEAFLVSGVATELAALESESLEARRSMRPGVLPRTDMPPVETTLVEVCDRAMLTGVVDVEAERGAMGRVAASRSPPCKEKTRLEGGADRGGWCRDRGVTVTGAATRLGAAGRSGVVGATGDGEATGTDAFWEAVAHQNGCISLMISGSVTLQSHLRRCTSSRSIMLTSANGKNRAYFCQCMFFGLESLSAFAATIRTARKIR